MLNSCCGMRLHTAGVVIGWIGIVGSFITVILMAVGVANADDLAQFIAEQYKSQSVNIDPATLRQGIIVIGSIYLGIATINLLASAMLVLGTVKERHLLLVPWLINSGIGLAISAIYNLVLWGVLISNGVSVGELLPGVLFAALALALQFYIYSAIYSLFKQIQAGYDAQRPLLRPAASVNSHSGTTYPSYTKI